MNRRACFLHVPYRIIKYQRHTHKKKIIINRNTHIQTRTHAHSVSFNVTYFGETDILCSIFTYAYVLHNDHTFFYITQARKQTENTIIL